MIAIRALLQKPIAALFALFTLLAGALSSPGTVTGNGWALENETVFPFPDGIAVCQGITCDGTCFYVTGTFKLLNYNAIVKLDAQSKDVVQTHEMCIPRDLMKRGYSHFGDCAVSDGKLYVACEDFGFRHPCIMVYDAQTLEFLSYHVLPDEGKGNGHLPWLCIADDVIYYTQARNVQTLHMLDLADFHYRGAVTLDRTLNKVSGGDIYHGTLYLNSDDGTTQKTIYTVDPATGHVDCAAVRTPGNRFTEAEGVSMVPLPDGTVFHTIDIFAFSQAILRSYSIS